MSTQTTIIGTLNFLSAFILNRPTLGVAGAFQEPGLTAANLATSTILSPPFAWQWNRKTANFTTTAGQSDYIVTIPDYGWMEKATRSNVTQNPQTVELQIKNVLAATSDQDPAAWISPIFDDNLGDITFRLMAVPDAVYTILITYQKAPIPINSLLGTIYGSTTSINASFQGTATYFGSYPLGAGNGLVGLYVFASGAVNTTNNGLFLCTQSSATQMTLQNPNAIAETPANAFIQAATTWAPIPDKLNFLYERAMLAYMYAMFDTQRYLAELQIFLRQLVGCSEGLSEVQKAIFLEDRLFQLRSEQSILQTSGTLKRGI